jgi:hypothetical protein
VVEQIVGTDLGLGVRSSVQVILLCCYLQRVVTKESFRPHHGRGFDTASSENEYQEDFWG